MRMTDNELNKALEKYKLAFLVRINYKSGTTQEFWCSDFDCERAENGISSLGWKNIPGLLMPISIGDDLGNIESIYQVEARPLEAAMEEGREKIERLVEHCVSYDEIEK